MDKKYEEIAIKFGKELASLCKKTNISSQSLREFADYIDALIGDIIEDYPEIDDTFVNLPIYDENYYCIDVIFVDGTEMTVSLGIETHCIVTGDIRVY